MSGVVNYAGVPVSVEWNTTVAGTASLTVIRPDGVQLTPSPTPAPDSSGKYTASFNPPDSGRYLLQWANSTDAFVDIVDVWDTSPRFLVSRDMAVERLRQNNNRSGTTFDSIMLYVAAASAVVEKHTGPLFITNTEWVEVSPHGQDAVTLPHLDVDVTEVTIDGSLISASAYVVDEAAGIVFVDVPRLGKVRVEYTVGSKSVPHAAQMACLEILAHSWQQTRQAMLPTPMDDTPMVTTSMGYAIPKRALEWLQAVPGAAGVA